MRSCSTAVRVVVIASMLALSEPGIVGSAYAQAPQADRGVSYNIPAGTLSEVLNRFAQASRVTLVYSAQLTRGVSSPGLAGTYPLQGALSQLLQGTGLQFSIEGSTVTIAPSGSATHRLGTLEVEGTNGANSAAGIGAATSTENTGSYTTDAMTIGSKTPQSIRETPQSVSVVTSQQMKDENLQSLQDVMNASPGIDVIFGGSGASAPQYFARGLGVSTFQIDGGAPVDNGVSISGFTPEYDMAEFDHVEILRGSDGMFAGYGWPAGTVNLVRKQPLDHDQVVVEASTGSWENERGMLDATGPLLDDGSLRGRAVINYQTQNYFYNVADERHTLLFGTLEYDLTSSTLLTLDSSYDDSNQVPWYDGLPRYASGAQIDFPRSTSLTLPWETDDIRTGEIGGRVEQQFGKDWSARFDVTSTRQLTDSKEGFIDGAVSPVNLTGPSAYGEGEYEGNRQFLVDLSVKGGFEVFGLRQELVAGGSYQYVADGRAAFYPVDYPTTPINIFPFSTSEYPDPATGPVYLAYPVEHQIQKIGYVMLRLMPVQRLHLLLGQQLASFHYRDISGEVDPTTGALTSPYISEQDQKWRLLPYYGAVFDLSRQWSLFSSFTNIYDPQSALLQPPFPPGVPNLPQTGDDVETGVKGSLRDGRLQVSLSVYRIDLDNQLGYDDNAVGGYGPEGSFCCYSPIGKNLSEGVDAEISGEILPGWQIAASYNYNENKIDYSTQYSPAGVPLESRFPKHMAKLWTSYALPILQRRLTVGGGVEAQSSTYESGTIPASFDPVTGDGNPPFTPFNFTQSGWGVLNLFAHVRVTEHLQAQLNLSNVTNKVYYRTVGTPEDGNWYGDPFNFNLTLRYEH